MTFVLRPSRLACVAALAFVACSSDPGNEDPEGGAEAPEPTTEGATETSTTNGSQGGSETTDTMETESETDFVPDEPAEPVPCDMWAQDCPEGQKCVPYASSGSSWDALKCVPILGEQAPGEPCTYAGPAEATDDCDATSMCWYADEEGAGTCTALCTGTPDAPTCDPEFFCNISGDSSLALCLPLCDPLTQEGCGEGLGCYWANQAFTCIPTTMDLGLGDDCGFVNDCAPGLICLDGTLLPDCQGSCCGGFCALSLGDQPCEDALPGTVCTSFWDSDAPEGYEDVGVCVLP